MIDRPTQCPKCSSIYKVSVAQLTVAQGMVCCPKCLCEFNALLHLIQLSTPQKTDLPDTQHIHIKHTNQEIITTSSDFLKIFNEKVEHSNIDLETYLNNLSYFSTEAIPSIPTLNLAEEKLNLSQQTAKRTYYITWGLTTSVLISILFFQLLMFNPKFLSDNPSVHQIFTKFCGLINCSDLEQQYSYINIRSLKTHSEEDTNINLIGELINQNDRSLPLPLLLLTLTKNKEIVFSRIYTSDEYLIPSLQNIKRIPINTPFMFDISLPLPEKNFDHYDLQIIRP